MNKVASILACLVIAASAHEQGCETVASRIGPYEQQYHGRVSHPEDKFEYRVHYPQTGDHSSHTEVYEGDAADNTPYTLVEGNDDTNSHNEFLAQKIIYNDLIEKLGKELHRQAEEENIFHTKHYVNDYHGYAKHHKNEDYHHESSDCDDDHNYNGFHHEENDYGHSHQGKVFENSNGRYKQEHKVDEYKDKDEHGSIPERTPYDFKLYESNIYDHGHGAECFDSFKLISHPHHDHHHNHQNKASKQHKNRQQSIAHSTTPQKLLHHFDEDSLDDYNEQQHKSGYKFEYGVIDPHTNDNKNLWEKRSGDVVEGAYSSDDADGTKRIVKYTTDKVNGLRAIVKRVQQTKLVHA